MDYRERAVAYKQEGHTFKQLREAFGIPSKPIISGRKNLTAGITKYQSNGNAEGR
jgi:hypothetical protein